MLDAMRMSTACFARAPQRCTSRLSKHFLLTFQEVTPLSKTRNQLIPSPETCFLLNTAWRGISTPRPAPLSEACLPELFSVLRGMRGVHPQ
jgi:hypothetical protein